MSLRARKWVFFAALPVVLVLALWQTRLETDLSAFFIGGTSEEEAFLANAVQSGELSRRYIISLGTKHGGGADLRGFAARYARALETLDDTDRVWDAAAPPLDPMEAAQLYAPHFAKRYSLDPERDAAELFRPDALERRAAALKQALLSPHGRLVKSIAVVDPMLLSLTGLKDFGERLVRRKDGTLRYVNLILESTPKGLDADGQGRLQRALEARFAALNAEAGNAYTLAYTGIPVFAVAAQKQIAGDIQTITLVSSAGIVLLFLWIFRSLGALHWVFMILVASLAVAALSTQWAFGHVHGLTLALGATLLGVCIDYPIHTLAHAGAAEPAQRVLAIRRIWPSLLMGGATTVIGYLALGLSGYPGFQQIALFAGSGIVVALALTRFVLPAFLVGQQTRKPRSRFLGAWIRACEKHRLPLAVLVALLTVAALASLPRLTWLDDLEKLTSGLSDLRERDRAIRARLVSIEPGRFVLIKARDTETALEKSERVYPILEKLKAQGVLEDFFGPYPWLLSESLQRRNERAYRAQLDQAHLSAWTDALRKNGLSVERLSRLAPPETPPLSPRAVLDSPVRHLLAGQLIEAADETLAIIWLASHQPDAIRAALRDSADARYFSQRDMLNDLAARYQHRAAVVLLIGLALIYALLLMRYRHPLPALQALAPALLAALFILAAFATTGHPVSFLHIVGFLLAVAICVDYGIFYVDNRTRDSALTYQAMGASMLTTLVAFGALALADNPTLRALSAAVGLGVLIGYLLCPALIATPGARSRGN